MSGNASSAQVILPTSPEGGEAATVPGAAFAEPTAPVPTLAEQVRDMELKVIAAAVAATTTRAAAAARLGISLRTLYYKLRQHVV